MVAPEHQRLRVKLLHLTFSGKARILCDRLSVHLDGTGGELPGQ